VSTSHCASSCTSLRFVQAARIVLVSGEWSILVLTTHHSPLTPHHSHLQFPRRPHLATQPLVGLRVVAAELYRVPLELLAGAHGDVADVAHDDRVKTDQSRADGVRLAGAHVIEEIGHVVV